MKTLKLTVLSIVVLFYGFLNNSIAQWVLDSNGIGNKQVSSFAFSGNTIFAGTFNNGGSSHGVYLSTDNGTSWAQTSLNNKYITALAVNGNTIFAGTGNGGGGVFVSTDTGTSWTQTSLNRTIYSLAVNGNNVFAGTFAYGVYLSTDTGTSWTQTSLNNQLRVYSLACSGNNVYAGTQNNGVYLSTDTGTSWTQTLLNNQSVLSLAVNGNNVFAGTYQNGVYISTNNGTSWIHTPLNNLGIYTLAINGNNIFAGTYYYPSEYGAGVYVSNNNGASWIPKNEGLGNFDEYGLCIVNNYIFAGTENSVWRRPFGELTGIKPISNETPNQFSLSQNYPNPFNPKTVISFQLAVNSFVSLKIYDILGREAISLVNEQLKPGTYEVNWNADKYSSGIYYYRIAIHSDKLTSGDLSAGSGQFFTETKKMILIK